MDNELGDTVIDLSRGRRDACVFVFVLWQDSNTVTVYCSYEAKIRNRNPRIRRQVNVRLRGASGVPVKGVKCVPQSLAN